MEYLTLNNGVEIPVVGFGAASIGQWQQRDDYVTQTISKAIEAGYLHIDTASLYGTERNVGKAVKNSGIKRDQFFISSKVWDTDQDYENTLKSFDDSLKRLEMDYLDLFLIHWPVESKTKETWQALEKLYDEKRVRAIGVCNFRQSDFEEIKTFANTSPCYNQIELHPYLLQQNLVNYCHDNNIAVTCWSPLGSGNWSGAKIKDKPISDPLIVQLAAKYEITPAQLILKWDIQQGRIVIPKSETPANMINNIDLFNFTLDESDITAINRLDRNYRFGGHPNTALENNLKMQVPA